MRVLPIKTYPTKNIPIYNNEVIINNLVMQVGQNVQMPNYQRNYCLFNLPLVSKIVAYREKALPPLLKMLGITQNEKQIAEGLYTLDRMIDSGVKGITKAYPVVARFNNTPSPTIQVLLAGIYRKTQVPDAFGPLWSMLMRNTLAAPYPFFNPNEEIGGAILEYMKNPIKN